MTRPLTILILLLAADTVPAQEKKPATLRELLLVELRSTHNNADWFVPGNTAVKGLSAEQASWTDGKGNHAIGQIAHHLAFWNRWSLERLKGSTEKYNPQTIITICTHNAYHIGQSIYVRREQGSWEPSMGVK